MKKIIFFYLFLIKLSILSYIKNNKRNLQEKSNDIVILHTNDVHCGVTDAIGYDGLMLLKKQLLKKYNYAITVDAGDHVQGGIMGVITKGEAIINIMNKIGYDVATLGNHEFDYQIPKLKENSLLLNCGYISINYCFHKNKTSIYNASKIIEKNNKKIGFIGISTPETFSQTYLNTLYDSEGNRIYDFLTENKNQELYNRIQEEINRLKNEENVDYIIILGHLGILGDSSEENTSAEVLKNIEGVDAFIDGHSHKVYSQTTPDKNSNNVILAQTGTKLNNIGILIIHENGSISHENIDEVPYESELDSETLNVTRSKKEYYVDKEMNEYINNIYESFSDELNKVIGFTNFSLTVYKNITESTDSDTQLSRVGENALCNLVTDAFRELGEADISIINAATVRAEIYEGNITYQKIIDVTPFSNDIEVKEITGQTILDALEYGLKSLPNPTSRFPQVSGITFKIDESINSSVVVDEDGIFQSVEGERKVYDVKINGEELDLNKNYTISSNNFILNGGDGYSMFSPFEVTKTAFGVDNEVLLKYINENLNGIIPAKYQNIENRIVKTNGKNNDDNDSDDNFTTRYYNQKSSGLNGVMVAIIVIVSIIVVAITIAIICLLKRKYIKNINETKHAKNNSDTINSFKIPCKNNN